MPISRTPTTEAPARPVHPEAPRRPLLARFATYQAERFPLAGYVPMIVVFTGSAAAYSRLARGVTEWIPWERFAVGAWTSLVLFFLLRVLDEGKDREQDRRFRPELPVPRGLVTLRELRALAAALVASVLLLNLLVAPRLLGAVALVLAYAALMTAEFGARRWLRAHPAAYLLSHMAILPLIDFYTTGLDWLAAAAEPPRALWLFLAVTYLNGIVVEIGRKLRAPADERTGVDTYTVAWGTRVAPAVWIATLGATALVAWLAVQRVGGGAGAAFALLLLATAAALPALTFLRTPRAAGARRIETASGLWTISMYLLLGAAPWALRAMRG